MLDITGFLTSTDFLFSLAAAITNLLTSFLSIVFGITNLFGGT